MEIPNTGKLCIVDFNVFSPFQALGHGQPAPYVVEEIFGLDTVMVGYVGFKLHKGFGKLTARAFAVSVFEMIETDGNLNQPLEEEPIRLPILVPEVFPDVVGFKEALLVEVPYALMKSLVHHETTYETMP